MLAKDCVEMFHAVQFANTWIKSTLSNHTHSNAKYSKQFPSYSSNWIFSNRNA